MMCGGTGPEHEANEEIQQIVDELRDHINQKTGQNYASLKAISYRSQVVAGMNYFVKVIYNIHFKNLFNSKLMYKKVNTGTDEHLHLRIYEPLPHTRQPPKIHSVLSGKALSDPIEYF